jgi:hypothetical protein
MRPPAVSRIRTDLEDIEGALTGDPVTSLVDLGDIPCTPISGPDDDLDKPLSDSYSAEFPLDDFGDDNSADDTPITFEIPPEIDEREVKTRLGSAAGSQFQRLIEVRGTDAYGWYLPFHYRIAQHGIYISSLGALQLAFQVFNRRYSDDFSHDLKLKLQFATHAILRHEAFHFAAECMAANWELASGAACYLKTREVLRNAQGYIEDEEALANAYMLRGFRWPNATSKGARASGVLKVFCRRQPPGYSDAEKYLSTNRYLEACNRYVGHYQLTGTGREPPSSFDNTTLYPNALRIDWRRCPIILADEHDLLRALGIVPKFIACVSVINETDRFVSQLRKLGSLYEAKWQKTKKKLAHTTQLHGLDFKEWAPGGKNYWSVRIDRDVRAHLRFDNGTWFADAIGRHDAMGHS